MERISGTDVELSPSTTTPKDPSVASPSVWPAPGAIAWVADGTGHTGASGAAVFAPGYDTSIMTGCVAPIMVGATSAVGSPVRPAGSSGIMAIIGCSATSEGAP